MFKFLNLFSVSNDELVEQLIERGFFKAEEIERDGNKLLKPTREEALATIKADDEKRKAGNQPPAQEPPASEAPKAPAANNAAWSQEGQKYPKRFYVKLKKHINTKRNDKGELEHEYEDLPMYYIDGVWYEDPEGKTEAAYHENLKGDMLKHLQETGEIIS